MRKIFIFLSFILYLKCLTFTLYGMELRTLDSKILVHVGGFDFYLDSKILQDSRLEDSALIFLLKNTPKDRPLHLIGISGYIFDRYFIPWIHSNSLHIDSIADGLACLNAAKVLSFPKFSENVKEKIRPLCISTIEKKQNKDLKHFAKLVSKKISKLKYGCIDPKTLTLQVGEKVVFVESKMEKEEILRAINSPDNINPSDGLFFIENSKDSEIIHLLTLQNLGVFASPNHYYPIGKYLAIVHSSKKDSKHTEGRVLYIIFNNFTLEKIGEIWGNDQDFCDYCDHLYFEEMYGDKDNVI